MDYLSATAAKISSNDRRRSGRRPAGGRGLGFGRAALVSVVALLAVGIAVLWLILDRYVQPSNTVERNELVRTLAQIVGGLVVLTGVYFTWQQVTNTRREVRIAQEGQITERFSRAIEQLGSEKLELRLG